MIKIGAHLSGASRPTELFAKAEAMGISGVQTFASPPSNWAPPKISPESQAIWLAQTQALKLSPNFFHAIYLLNLGSDNPELLEKSIQAQIAALTLAPLMGVAGTIFHTGSHKGRGFEAVKDQVIAAFERILSETPSDSWLVIENNAGQGNLIGRDNQELSVLINGVKPELRPRLKVCIDTCHAFANGTDWRDLGQTKAFWQEFDQLVGLNRLVAIHANDSKFECGMNKDRHENIGLGLIGDAGWRNLLALPELQDKTFYLEVPGLAGEGPDKANVDKLKQLASEAENISA